MVMFNWLSGRGKTTASSRDKADWRRLEQKIEQLEQTVQLLAKETRRQSIVVRELHINQPVVENVTFRLDALDIEDLSGSLNLGNNFDVQFDPQQLFRSGKNEGGGRNATAGRSERAPEEADADRPAHSSRDNGVAEALRRTSSGYSYRSSPTAPSRAPSPNPDSTPPRKPS